MSEQDKSSSRPRKSDSEGTRVAKPLSSPSGSGSVKPQSSSSQSGLSKPPAPKPSSLQPPKPPAETTGNKSGLSKRPPPKTIDESEGYRPPFSQEPLQQPTALALPPAEKPPKPTETSGSRSGLSKNLPRPALSDATSMATPGAKSAPVAKASSLPAEIINTSPEPIDVSQAFPELGKEVGHQTKAAIRPTQVVTEPSQRSMPAAVPPEDDSGKLTAISQSIRKSGELSLKPGASDNVRVNDSLAKATPQKRPLPENPELSPPPISSDRSLDDRSLDEDDSGRMTMVPIYTESSLPLADLSLVNPEDRYVEAEEFARGGLGRISRSYDKRLGRYIALKEILVNDSLEVEQRFLQEAQITARLEHPSIVPVHDLGRWRGGGVYYAMKLVNGRSLDKVVGQKKNLRERLSLLPHAIDACEAMAYAHAQKIIHRDLKPQNILVGSFGETVVIDWGIAKEVTNAEGASQKATGKKGASFDPRNEMTEAGAILGTPAYMAPEQARGELVDERTDVYALGCIIYYILCGKSPYAGEKRKNSAALIGELLDGPPTPLESREPDVPKELLAIINKAMAREPKDRYPTAKELAEDIKKFQTGQIVGAYHYSFTEIVKRFIKRNKAAVIVGTVLFSLLLFGGIFSYVSIVRSSRSEHQARLLAEEESKQKTQRSFALLLQLLRQSIEKDPMLAIAYAKELLSNPDFTDWRKIRTLVADALSRGIPKTLGAPWSKEGPGHSLTVTALDISPDGAFVATSSDDRSVRLWDLSTGAPKAVLKGHADAAVEVKVSPTGQIVASAGASGDQTVRLWDASSGKERFALLHQGAVNDIAFSPDGALLASASEGEDENVVSLWDVESGVAKAKLLGHTGAVLAVRFSPDGKKLASYGEDEDYSIRLWDAKPNAKPTLLEGHTDVLYAMAFSPDGRFLASGGEDFNVRLWDLTEEKPSSGVLSGHVWKIRAIAFTPDNKRVISAGEDKAIRIWKVDSCRQKGCSAERVLDKHQGSVVALSVSPDGKYLASAAQDQTVRLWDIESGREVNVFRGHTGAIRDVAFSPDGKLLVSAGDDAIPRVWDLTSIEKGVFAGHTGFVYAIAFSPDGEIIASGGEDATVRLWDADTGQEIRSLQHGSQVWEVKFSPDGRLLAAACNDGLTLLWEVSTGRTLVTLKKHDAEAYGLAFSRDGKTLASAGVDQTVRLWDVATGNLLRNTQNHKDEVLDLDVAPDNSRFASASLDGSIWFWDTKTGEPLQEFKAQGKQKKRYSSVAFSPDKKILAAGNYSSEVEIWRLDEKGFPTGESKILRSHQGEVEALSFTPDGLTLASASWDGTVRLWDVDLTRWNDPWESRVLRSYGKDVDAVAFSPDGKQIAFASEDELVHLFSNDLPEKREDLQKYLDSIPTPSINQR